MRRTWLATGMLVVGGLVAAHLARPLTSAVAEDAAKPAYVGADKCKACHIKTFKSWGQTGMAKAFEVLKPGQAAEKKTAAKLDPNADFTKDAKCLKCHTTGYGADGYPALEADAAPTAEQTAAMTANAGVTCEACHGPGSLYIPVKKANKEYKFEEIAKLGAVKGSADVCTKCHVKECPTMPEDYAFDAAAKMKDPANIHEHVPLKNAH